MKNLQRRTKTNSKEAKMISNELFVSLIKYGKVVQSLYNKQLKQKYSSLYRQFMDLQKQMNDSLKENSNNE